MYKHEETRPIVDYLQDVVNEFGSFPAVISEASVVTYEQLMAAILEFAYRFRAVGVNKDSVVAISTNDIQVTLCSLFATSLIGCQITAASEVLSKNKVVKPTHFFKTNDSKGKHGVNFQEIDRDWFSISQSHDIEKLRGNDAEVKVDDPWLLLHTSGTTGRHKFIYLSQRIVANRTNAVEDDFPIAQVTCALLFGYTTRPFFARAIAALLNACTIVDSQDSKFWKLHGVNTVFCSPSQYELFLRDKSITERFHKVEVSGAKLEDSLAVKLSENFDTIVDVYGASETNKSYVNLVNVSEDGTITRYGQKLDSDIEILNGENEMCAQGQTGTVRVKNDYVVDGYVNAPEATEKSFKEGWFYRVTLPIGAAIKSWLWSVARMKLFHLVALRSMLN